jgi:membrane fusion protein (multidrug efflux system)
VFVEQQGKARAVAIEVGARTADRVQVTSGLNAGDHLIVSNLLRLKDGARVRAKVPGSAR